MIGPGSNKNWGYSLQHTPSYCQEILPRNSKKEEDDPDVHTILVGSLKNEWLLEGQFHYCPHWLSMLWGRLWHANSGDDILTWNQRGCISGDKKNTTIILNILNINIYLKISVKLQAHMSGCLKASKVMHRYCHWHLGWKVSHCSAGNCCP